MSIEQRKPAMPRYKNGDYLFDGFAHRSFDERFDGWRNAMPDPAGYPAVQHANDVLDLFEALTAARIRIWELERELETWKPLIEGALR